MNRLRIAVEWAARVCAALVLYGVAVLAQAQVTTLTATQQQWGGLWLTQGVISMIPVTPLGQPITFSANGKFYPPRSGFDAGFQGTVVRGALTAPLIVPDKTSATAAYPLCYDLQIKNSNTLQVVDIGVRCDITGASVSLDAYVPPVTPPILLSGYSHGTLAQMPTGCAAGALYGADDTNGLYKCGLDGHLHLMLGSGGDGISPATLLLADASTPGAYYTLTLAMVSGIERIALSASASGTGAVPAVTFTDSATPGAYLALGVNGGRLAVSPGTSSGAVASLALVDSSSGASHTLSAGNGRLSLN